MDYLLNQLRDHAFIKGIKSAEKLTDQQIKEIAKMWFYTARANTHLSFEEAWEKQESKT